MVRHPSSITISSPSREFEQLPLSDSIKESARTVLLLDNQLTVSWDKVPGVTAYLIQIKRVGDQSLIWEQVSNGTKIVYSGNVEPEVEYELVIKPHGNQSKNGDAVTRFNEAPKKSPAAELSRFRFLRLDEDVAQRVQEAEETLAKLELPEASTALNQLYQSLFVTAGLSSTKRASCADLYQINPAWCCSHPPCFTYPPCRVRP